MKPATLICTVMRDNQELFKFYDVSIEIFVEEIEKLNKANPNKEPFMKWETDGELYYMVGEGLAKIHFNYSLDIELYLMENDYICIQELPVENFNA